MKVRKSVARLMVGVALPLGTMFLGAGSANAFPGGTSSGTPNACMVPHHSSTGRGANTASGPYDGTCDGRPSGAGLGSGAAVGRPFAGAVGNADFKQPPGQFPDGTDHNNGYECDGNNGISRENPAHTSCTPPECNPSTDPDKCEPPVCDPDKDEYCKDDLIA